MSLINEALKRAKQAPARPVIDPAAEPVLQPAVPGEGMAWLRPVISLVILLLAIWFLGLWWHTSREPAREATVAPDPANSLAAAVIGASNLAAVLSAQQSSLAPGPSAVSAEVRKPSNLENVVASDSPASEPNHESQATAAMGTAAPALSSPAPEPNLNEPLAQPNSPALADLKLQGIFFRASKACVLINGQTLFLGDEIDGARVAGIERQAVQLVVAGKTNVLRLR